MFTQLHNCVSIYLEVGLNIKRANLKARVYRTILVRMSSSQMLKNLEWPQKSYMQTKVTILCKKSIVY